SAIVTLPQEVRMVGLLRRLARICDVIAPIPETHGAAVASLSRRRFGAAVAAALAFVAGAPSRAWADSICPRCNGFECGDACTPLEGPCPMSGHCWCDSNGGSIGGGQGCSECSGQAYA